MCPGSWTAPQTNKQTPGVILILPTQTSCTIIFGKSLKTTIYVHASLITPQKMGPMFFSPWDPQGPRPTSGSKDKETTILDPAVESWGCDDGAKGWLATKKNLGKNRIFFSWDLNGSARETVLKCQFFTSFQLRDCQTKSRQYRRVWINQEGFELRLPWGDPRYLQLRSS